MSSMKPLTYQCLQMVLQEMSFLKRKKLHARCPAIRKLEERLGYRLNDVSVQQSSKHCTIEVDDFKIEIDHEDETKKCSVIMRNKKTGITVNKSMNVNPEEAAEKWITYILNRPDTRIQHLYLLGSPICILKLDHPMTVINLIIFVYSAELPKDSGRSSWLKTTVPVKHLKTNILLRDDTMKAARSVMIPAYARVDAKILSKMQANKITMDISFPLEQIVTYCRRIAKSGQPIGFCCKSWIQHRNLEFRTLDWLAESLNARKTSWNGRKCFTISLNDASELNVHGNLDKFSDRLIIEVNARGTAIDR